MGRFACFATLDLEAYFFAFQLHKLVSVLVFNSLKSWLVKRSVNLFKSFKLATDLLSDRLLARTSWLSRLHLFFFAWLVSNSKTLALMALVRFLLHSLISSDLVTWVHFDVNSINIAWIFFFSSTHTLNH